MLSWLEAQRLAAAVAVAAVAAGVAEPRQRDAHARLEAVLVAGAEPLDDADALVAGDERRRGLHRPLAAGGVDVGVAEPGRLDADEHLLGAGLGMGTSSIASGRSKLRTTAAFMSAPPSSLTES